MTLDFSIGCDTCARRKDEDPVKCCKCDNFSKYKLDAELVLGEVFARLELLERKVK